MNIKEFEKELVALIGKKPNYEYTPSGECSELDHWVTYRKLSLWGAKWAFETAAKEAESFGDFKGRAVALSIRTLAQSLEEKP